jgi:hypothetical protein
MGNGTLPPELTGITVGGNYPPPGTNVGGYGLQFPTQTAALQTPAPPGMSMGGITPQPPTPSGDVQAGGGFTDVGADSTLGDVTAAGGAPGMGGQPLDVGQAYQNYSAMLDKQYQAAKRPYLDESTKPGLAMNLATFGMAGLFDRDYRNAYNAGVDRHNADLHMKVGQQALNLVGADINAHNAFTNRQVQWLQMQANIANASYRRLMEGLNLQYKMTSPIPTEEQRAAWGDVGLEPGPSRFPGRVVPRPIGGGGGAGGGYVWDPTQQTFVSGGGGGGAAGYTPATPGSPTANALGGGQGGKNPAGQAPSDAGHPGADQPTGPLTSAKLRQIKAQQAAEAAAAKTAASTSAKAQQEARQNVAQIKAYFNSPDYEKATQILPHESGMTTPLSTLGERGRFKLLQSTGQSNDQMYYLQRGAQEIIPQLRSTGLNRITSTELEQYGKAFNQLASGGLSYESAQAFKRSMLKGLDERLTAIEGAGPGAAPPPPGGQVGGTSWTAPSGAKWSLVGGG